MLFRFILLFILLSLAPARLWAQVIFSGDILRVQEVVFYPFGALDNQLSVSVAVRSLAKKSAAEEIYRLLQSSHQDALAKASLEEAKSISLLRALLNPKIVEKKSLDDGRYRFVLEENRSLSQLYRKLLALSSKDFLRMRLSYIAKRQSAVLQEVLLLHEHLGDEVLSSQLQKSAQYQMLAQELYGLERASFALLAIDDSPPRLKEAEKAMNDALSYLPNGDFLLVSKARLYIKSGDLLKAKEVLRQAFLKKESFMLRLIEGELQLKLGNQKEAKKSAILASNFKNGLFSDAREELADLLEKLLEPKLAQKQRKFAYQIDPSWQHAYTVGLHEKNDQKALFYLEKSWSLNPLSAKISLALASRYSALGDLERSIYHLRMALSQDPNNIDLLATLGFSYFQRGTGDDVAMGLSLLQQVLILDPKNQKALNFLKQFKKKAS